MPGFSNYSKWDRLEVSDDEKDFHPNIDASLMIRIKREQRARREAEEDERIAALKKEGTTEALTRVEKIEANRKLHIGNICTVVDEKTLLNKAAPITASTPDLSEETIFEHWVSEHEDAVYEYAELDELKDMEQYLHSHPEILCEHACSILLLKMLDLEMADMRDVMLHVVRQYLVLRNILDLGIEARRSQGKLQQSMKQEELRPFVQLFFKTVNNDESKKTALEKESLAFGQNIILRAQQKKLELQ